MKRINRSFNNASFQHHAFRAAEAIAKAETKGLTINRSGNGWEVVLPNGQQQFIANVFDLVGFVSGYRQE